MTFSPFEYQREDFSLMGEARNFVINHYDMSVAWIVERDYHAKTRPDPKYLIK